jgi:hypothetical protein
MREVADFSASCGRQFIDIHISVEKLKCQPWNYAFECTGWRSNSSDNGRAAIPCIYSHCQNGALI